MMKVVIPYDRRHKTVHSAFIMRTESEPKTAVFLAKPTETDRRQNFWNRNNTTNILHQSPVTINAVWYLSRHCLPVRPLRCLAITAQCFVPCCTTRVTTLSSSWQTDTNLYCEVKRQFSVTVLRLYNFLDFFQQKCMQQQSYKMHPCLPETEATHVFVYKCSPNLIKTRIHHVIITCTYQLFKWQSADTNVQIGRYRLSAKWTIINR